MSKTVADVLEQARAFHARLAAFYGQQEKSATSERVRLVLGYLSRHEQRMAKCLDAYREAIKHRVADTWYKNPPDVAGPRCFDEMQFRADMTVDEVIRLALRMDDCLLQLYRTLAEHAVSAEVRDLFTELLAVESGERHRMVRDAEEVEDF